LHEVAADAALYFDPEDEQAMAAAVSRLLEDDALRQTLIARGQAQAAKFSWAACAQATLASYYRAALTEEQA
jgi:glycosyltransferase involved in cell wall biosynthesis